MPFSNKKVLILGAGVSGVSVAYVYPLEPVDEVHVCLS